MITPPSSFLNHHALLRTANALTRRKSTTQSRRYPEQHTIVYHAATQLL